MRSAARQGFDPRWLEPTLAEAAWTDLEREFRAATREIGRMAGDALYGPLIADLERKIAERDARNTPAVERDGQKGI